MLGGVALMLGCMLLMLWFIVLMLWFMRGNVKAACVGLFDEGLSEERRCDGCCHAFRSSRQERPTAALSAHLPAALSWWNYHTLNIHETENIPDLIVYAV